MDNKANRATANTELLRTDAGDGLFLRGLVVAVEKSERTWENTRYNQLKATIVDGKNAFFYTATDKVVPLPDIVPFSRIAIEVSWAHKEKGVMTVRGELAAS